MNKSTIMIIDDEEQMRQLIRTLLEDEGYTVIEATDGVDALLLIDKTTPQLLIVDVMMPYMDVRIPRARTRQTSRSSGQRMVAPG